jgi:hypothetical protein
MQYQYSYYLLVILQKLTPVSPFNHFSAFLIYFLRSANFCFWAIYLDANLAALNNQKFAVFLKNRI